MSAIRLYGDTSGYTEIAAQSVAGNNTITLPASGGLLLGSDSRILTIGRRTTPYQINLVGAGITVALRSGIGTINF